MPIYEYMCKRCGQFEVMQRITEGPLTRCPTCERKVTKLISQTSFQLKGSGWYVTDYARKDGKGPEKNADSVADGPSATKAEPSSKADSSSDAKASKSDAKVSKSKEVAAA